MENNEKRGTLVEQYKNVVLCEAEDECAIAPDEPCSTDDSEHSVEEIEDVEKFKEVEEIGKVEKVEDVEEVVENDTHTVKEVEDDCFASDLDTATLESGINHTGSYRMVGKKTRSETTNCELLR